MLRERLQVVVEALGVLRLRVDDLTVNIHRVVGLERWIASKHLVQQDAERPPVDSLTMTFIKQNLGRNVLRSSTNCIGSLLDDLGETEINQFEITVRLDHNVLGLQITVDNLLGLKILKDSDDLRAVEFSLLRIEVADATMEREEITALQQLRDEVDIQIVLHESVVIQLHNKQMVLGDIPWRTKMEQLTLVTYDEWMLQNLKNLLLVLNVVDVLRVDNFLLLHRLNGELGGWLLLQPRVFDVTEGTCMIAASQCL